MGRRLVELASPLTHNSDSADRYRGPALPNDEPDERINGMTQADQGIEAINSYAASR